MKEMNPEETRNISMVDISDKPPVKRRAIASGVIKLKPSTVEMIKKGRIKKGDPIIVGKIAALNAVKQTPFLIPMCHAIPITHVKSDAEIGYDRITVKVEVTSVARTGVEMEALMGVSVFLNVIWDMTKYLEKDENGQYPDTMIGDIRVLRKEKIPLSP